MQQLELTMADAPLLADAPLPPYYRKNHETGEITEITRSEYKKSMLAEFTVRNNVNPTCRHSVLIGSEPTHRNCEACWFAYFQIHGEVTKIADEIFQQHSRAEAETIITQIKGKKFWKNFTKFMSTLARFKAATEAAQEQDEQRSTSSPQSSGEPEGGDGASVQAGGTEEGS